MKYVAIISRKDGLCRYVTVLEELIPDAASAFDIQREVDTPYYQGRRYDIANERWTDEYLIPPAPEEPMTIEERVEALANRIEAKIDYDIAVNLEQDYQLAMIEINTAKGGE